MDRVAIITGGATGIGKRMVEDFARAGYKVSFSYLTSEDSAMTLVDSLVNEGHYVICKKMDLSSDESINDFVNFTLKKFNKVDVLVNNGATTNDSLFRDKISDTFMRVLRVNLVGTFTLSKVVGDLMKKQEWGRIINISSTNGINTYFPMCLEYDASKAGLNSLTHNLAMQLSPYVTVNAIAPGFIGTENELKDMDAEFIKAEEEKILVKRIGEPEDVSNLAMFLASDKASYINNQIIKVNGGIYGD